MYALIVNQKILSVGNPPSAALALDGSGWISPPNGVWTNVQLALCGWIPLIEAVRPSDTSTTTTDYSVALVSEIPTQVWTSRNKTSLELSMELPK